MILQAGDRLTVHDLDEVVGSALFVYRFHFSLGAAGGHKYVLFLRRYMELQVTLIDVPGLMVMTFLSFSKPI